MVESQRFFNGRDFFMKLSRKSAVLVFVIAWLWFSSANLGKIDALHLWDSIPDDMLHVFRSEIGMRAFLSVVIAVMGLVSVVIESVFLRFIIHLANPEPPLSLTRSALISMLAYLPWTVFTLFLIYWGHGANLFSSHMVKAVFVCIHAVLYWAMASSSGTDTRRSLVALILIVSFSALFAIPQFV